MAVSDQPGNQIDQEVDRTAMARMLDLTDVFELIIDGLNNGLLAQEQLVGEREQAIVHLFTELGDQLKSGKRPTTRPRHS